jgi:hypothetical protein
MNDMKKLRTDVTKWAKRIGRKEAVRRLMNLPSRPSSSMAERLVKGTYDSDPHVDTAEEIRAEISKDDGSPASERAS